MDLAGIGAALKGMFRLRPNNAAHKKMLEDLDDLRAMTANANTRPANDIDEAIKMILGGRDA